jgi:hypothetical protein
MQRTAKEALTALLEHSSHKSLNLDISALSKIHDCDLIAKNLCTFAKENLTEVQHAHLLGNKETLISKETISSWATKEGRINRTNETLLKLFLGEMQISEFRTPQDNFRTERNQENMDIPLIYSILNEFEGKTYWCYNRIMGAYDNFEYGGDSHSNMSNKLVSSLVTFEEITPNGIKVRRKTSHFQYEGRASVKGPIMYIELEEPHNSLNFEQNRYTARIDNSHNLKVLYFIRTCLVNGAPQAIREIMVEAEGINYDETEMSSEKRFVEIDALPGNYQAEILHYLGDASNVILTTHSLKKEDYEARIQHFATHAEANWNIAASFLSEYTAKLAEIVLSDTVEIPILTQSSIMHFYDDLLNNMLPEHTFYVTSLPTKKYLWQKESIELLEQTVSHFVQRGGTFRRFFFVDSLLAEDLLEEQAMILKTHYEMYGNLEGNNSAVYLVNYKKLMPNQKVLIAIEKNQKSIACTIKVKGKMEDLDVIMDKLIISTNKAKIKKYGEIFDYFEECAQRENSIVVKKVSKVEVAFWEEKFQL